MSTKFEDLYEQLKLTLTLNKEYIANYLTYNSSDTEQTIYNNIFELPAAHYLLVDDSGVQIKPYWKLKKPKYFDNIDMLAKYSELRSLIKTGFVDVASPGFELSGGLDSSSLLLLYDKKSTVVNVFSNEDENAKSYESMYIRETLKKINYDYEHHSLNAVNPYSVFHNCKNIFDQCKQPVFGSYGFFAEPLLKKAKDVGTSDIFSGFGGDQVASWFQWGFLVSWLQTKQLAKLFKMFFSNPSIVIIKRIIISVPIFYIFSKVKSRANYPQFKKYKKSMISESLSSEFNTMKKNYNSGMESLCDFHEQKVFSAIRQGHINKIVKSRKIVASLYGVDYKFPYLNSDIFDLLYNLPVDAHYLLGKNRKFIKDAMGDYIKDNVLDKSIKASESIPGYYDNLVKHHLEFLQDRFKYFTGISDIANLVDLNKVALTLRSYNKRTGINRFVFHAWMMSEFILWFKENHE